MTKLFSFVVLSALLCRPCQGAGDLSLLQVVGDLAREYYGGVYGTSNCIEAYKKANELTDEKFELSLLEQANRWRGQRNLWAGYMLPMEFILLRRQPDPAAVKRAEALIRGGNQEASYFLMGPYVEVVRGKTNEVLGEILADKSRENDPRRNYVYLATICYLKRAQPTNATEIIRSLEDFAQMEPDLGSVVEIDKYAAFRDADYRVSERRRLLLEKWKASITNPLLPSLRYLERELAPLKQDNEKPPDGSLKTNPLPRTENTAPPTVPG